MQSAAISPDGGSVLVSGGKEHDRFDCGTLQQEISKNSVQQDAPILKASHFYSRTEK